MRHQGEKQRLAEAQSKHAAWKKWGPYLSERQWGTVREDYSEHGDAWNYFTHDQARSRAYRWGEDGLGGISDDHQVLCFALALWNGCDPILKERAFGLANNEGNHGEDVKEHYFYLDSTPTHSYMKYLYKYPQVAYPYADLVETNRSRGRGEPEYELLDTGVFDDNRYFDVFVEYAKAAPEDLLVRISVFNRGDRAAPLHLLPTLWFRNTWSYAEGGSKPLVESAGINGQATIHAHQDGTLLQQPLGDYYLYCDADVPLLFTENETNNARLFGTANASPYTKDGINDFIVRGDAAAVNPARTGTKAACHYQLDVGGGDNKVVRLRLTTRPPGEALAPFDGFDNVFADRLMEADDFYTSITPLAIRDDRDRSNVMRQALAGMLWSKQYFYYDLDLWLEEHGAGANLPLRERRRVRNSEWAHMFNDDIISMPDKWEYPWYAAWDLAFHIVPLSAVDPDFAKQQLDVMLRNDYLHPNGQLPAYEWNFSDVNPPVHAWATMQLYVLDKEGRDGRGDIEFLKYAFSKLLVNFTWWVNRKDRAGANVFDGGFLGLDNIGVFDRSSPMPTGGYLPVWMPINFLLYSSLIQLYTYFGDGFKIECPTRSGNLMSLLEVARELGDRLSRIFLRDGDGRRPSNGPEQAVWLDPHWRDLVLFHEYFHGDTGAGVGASHQTGWTGCIARILQINAVMSKDLLLMPGAEAAAMRALREHPTDAN